MLIAWVSIAAIQETALPAETCQIVVTESSQFVLTDSGNSYNLTRIFKRTFSPTEHIVKVAAINPWSWGVC